MTLEEFEDKQRIHGDKWESLAKLAKDESKEVRLEIIGMLALFHDIKSGVILCSMLNDEDNSVRASACDSLAFSDSPDVLEALIKTLNDNYYLVRAYAALSVGDVQKNIGGDMRETKSVLEAQFENEKIRWTKIAISRSLYVLGNAEYLDIIMSSMNSGHYKNRCFAISIIEDFLKKGIIERDATLEKLNQRMRVEKIPAVRSKLAAMISSFSANDE